MFIRPCYKKSNGKKLAYRALAESYRTPQGPRQRIVGYFGQIKEAKPFENAGRNREPRRTKHTVYTTHGTKKTDFPRMKDNAKQEKNRRNTL